MSIGSFLFECAVGHSSRVQCIIQVGSNVWSCSSSGSVLIHNKQGEKVAELQIPSRGLTLDYASSMVVVGDSEVWCGLSSGGVCVYRNGELAEEMTDGHNGGITSIAWSERTKTVWTGGGDFNILGWSAMDKKRNGVCLQGHTDWVRCLLVCNGRLWSGSDDKTIRMWAESGSNSSPAAVVESHRGGVLCIARVGDAVWSGGADRQICRFDLAGSEKTAPLTAHKGRVMAIESCGKSVWSGSSDRHCLVWSLTTQRVLSDLNDFGGAVGAIAAVDGWCVWTGAGDGRLRCWIGSDRPLEKDKQEMISPAAASPPPQRPSPRVTIAFSEEEEEEEIRERQPRRKLLLNKKTAQQQLQQQQQQQQQQEQQKPSQQEQQQTPEVSPIRKIPELFAESYFQSPRSEQRQMSLHVPAQQQQEPAKQNQQNQQFQPQQQLLQQSQLQPQFGAVAGFPVQQSFYQPSFAQPSFVQPSFYPVSAPQQQQQQQQPLSHTIIFAPPSPAQPSNNNNNSNNNDALVSHLRESYQQLRNAYLTLQDKHELIREQHHRQLVQIEENHRREIDHLRKEFALELESARRASQANASSTSLVVSRPSGPSFEEMRMLNDSIRRRISSAIGK